MNLLKLEPERFAVLVIGGALALTCLAAVPQDETKSSNDFSHVVQINTKSTVTGGDEITITDVRGPSEKWMSGGTYEVRGKYKLASREEAFLGAFVTDEISAAAEVPTQVAPSQMMKVSKGEGQFALRFEMRTGAPHVALYPAAGGASFLSIHL